MLFTHFDKTVMKPAIVTFPTAPHTEVTEKGDIVYSEVVWDVHKLEAYVEEMASGDTVSGTVNIQKVQDDVLKLWGHGGAVSSITTIHAIIIHPVFTLFGDRILRQPHRKR
jgi:Fatty acid synthase type I helical domain